MEEKRKPAFEPKVIIKNDDYNYKEKLSKYVTEYDNDVEGLETLIVKEKMDDIGWNQHLLEPLIGGATVYIHPDQTKVDEQYVRVIHGNRKAISIFGKHNFQ